MEKTSNKKPMKKQTIFKSKIVTLFLPVAALVTALILTTVFVVQNFNKKEGTSTELYTTLTEDHYESYLTTVGKQIQKEEMIFEEDGTGTGAKLVGFNFGSSGLNKYNADRYLIVPEYASVNGVVLPVKEIDFSWITAAGLNGQLPEAIPYIKGIVLPNTIEKIEEASFFGFGAVEYIKTPFIGIARGSSAYNKTGTGGIDTRSYPLVSMFYNPTTFKNDAYEGDTWLDDYDSTNPTSRTAGPNITAQYAKWYDTLSVEDLSAVENYMLPGNLQKVVVYDDIEIGNRAIFNISSLRYIDIENQSNYPISVWNYAFAENPELIHVNLPETNLTISNGQGIFSLDQNLGSDGQPIILPAGENSIPFATFSNCLRLKEVIIPTTIRTIGAGAFADCNNLIKITKYVNYGENENINNTYSSWKYDGDSTIYQGGYNLPEGLRKIEEDAFKNCFKMVDITIPKNVQYIGSSAFAGCNNLSRLSVPFIGNHRGNYSECSTTCSSAGKLYHNLFGVIFGNTNSSEATYAVAQNYKDGGNTKSITYYVPKRLATVHITDETSVDFGSLMNLKEVKTLVLGPTITNVTEGALYGAAKLEELSIPFAGQKNIGGHIGYIFGSTAYTNSVGASGYQLPSTLTTISLTNAPTVYTNTFANCSNITTVIISEKTQTMQEQIFFNNKALKNLTLPFVGNTRGWWYAQYWCSGCQQWHSSGWWWRDNAWRNTLQWLFQSNSQGSTDLYANNSLKYSEDSYIKYIPKTLTTVTITDDTFISTYAFRYFTSLKTINITSKRLGSIDEYALLGCSSLENLTIPYIGRDKNVNNNSNQYYTLGWIFGEANYANAYAVSQYATYYIPKSLKNVTVGDESQSISGYAFNGCSSISTINIGSSNNQINTVASHAFANCTNLNELKIYNARYTSLGDYAFYNCIRLDRINNPMIFPATLESIGHYALAGTSVGGVGVGANGEELGIDLTKYTYVGNYAFANCLNIQEIEIPESLSFGEGVFQDCASLSNVTLSGKVSKNLFKNCVSLESIDFTGITDIPEGVLSGCVKLSNFKQNSMTYTIGAYAFYNCKSLDHFDINNKTTYIGAYAFSGCTGFDHMIIPKETTKIVGHGWDNCDPNFYFRVYKKKADWPAGWVDNWNCYYPVYVIGGDDDATFTYEYLPDHKAYFITGVEEGITLEGQITIPTDHNGLRILGINNKGKYNEETGQYIDGTQLSKQTNITSVIIPSCIYYISGLTDNGESPFATLDDATRTDIYFEATEAQIKAYRNKIIDGRAMGWDINSSNHNKLINGGLIFYGDVWEYSKYDGVMVPHLLLDKAEVTIDESRRIYKASAFTPEVLTVKLPGYVVNSIDLDVNETLLGMQYYIINNAGDQVLDEDFIDMFNATYKNNVAAGNDATVTLNIKTGRYNEYVNYLKNNGYNPIYIKGSVTKKFGIEKAKISVFDNSEPSSFGYTTMTETYNGSVKKYGSDWNYWSDKVTGLEMFAGTQFTGTLATDDSIVGMYLDGFGISWSSDYKIRRNGVDITDNFEVYVNLIVDIVPMKVAINWTGAAAETELDALGNIIYTYPYNGILLPGETETTVNIGAYAYQYGDEAKGKLKNCEVTMYHPKLAGSGYEPGAYVYSAYAYLTDNYNYTLVYSSGLDAGKAIQAGIHANGTVPNLIADDCYYRIGKGLIEIRLDVYYKIPSNVDTWKFSSFTSSGVGSLQNSTGNSTSYLRGLGRGTKFEGTLMSNSDAEGTYTYTDALEKDVVVAFTPNVSVEFMKYIYWKEITKDYGAGDTKTKQYHIYSTLSENPVDESDYYDVVIRSAELVIAYSSFLDEVLTYMVTLPEVDENGNVHYDDAQGHHDCSTVVKKNIKPENKTSDGTTTKDKAYHYVTFTVDGRIYHFQIMNDNAENIVDYKTHYFVTSINGEAVSQDINAWYIENQKPGLYGYGITLSGRHYSTQQITLTLRLVKSDIQFGEFTRPYNRHPIDIDTEPGMIIKKGFDVLNSPWDITDETQILTYEFYEYKNNKYVKIDSAPVDVGKYKVIINANETEFFNGLEDAEYFFEITKRKIVIDITGQRKYNGQIQSFTPDSAALAANGTLLGEEIFNDVHYGADTFVGTLSTKSALAGVYTYPTKMVWTVPWSVYDDLNQDNSKNYEVEVIGQYEILPLEFTVVVNDYEGDYDGNYHPNSLEPAVVVTRDPADLFNEEFHVYYSMTSIGNNYSNCLKDMPYSFDEPGTYTVYFAVVGDHYLTYKDSFKVKINLLTIEYDNHDGDDGLVDKVLRVPYTGSIQTYEIDVISPYFAEVLYREWVYETNSWTDWSPVPPMHAEAGAYKIQYRISAQYFETVEDEITFNISENVGDDLDEDKIHIIPYQGEYDGESHGVTVTSDYVNYKVVYSLDKVEWSEDPYEWTETGTYPVYVKFLVPNYKTYFTENPYIVKIEPRKFETNFAYVTDVTTTFDGEYHSVGIESPTNKIIVETTTSLDPLDPTVEVTTTKTYYYDAVLDKNVEIKFEYTSNQYVVAAGYGYTDSLEYKDAGQYRIFVRVSAENYESVILNNAANITQNYGIVKINKLENPEISYEYTELEYTGSPVDTTKLNITTASDGYTIFKYWVASYDAKTNKLVCDFTEQILNPTTVGYYCFTVAYTATKNCGAAALTEDENGDPLFFAIVPKVLEVKWDEVVEYDTFEHGPNPSVDTGIKGVNVELVYNFKDPSITEAIEVGDYEFSVEMLYENPNFVLDRDTIVMSIKKRKIQFFFEDKKEYDGTIYKKTSGWEDVLQLALLTGQKFVASVETNRYIKGTYIYDSEVPTTSANFAIVNWDIIGYQYEVDADGKIDYDSPIEGTEFSAKDLYDVEVYILIKITDPVINLDSVTDTVVYYDGEPHALNVLGQLAAIYNGAIIQYREYNPNNDPNEKWVNSSYQQIEANTYQYEIRVQKAGFETSMKQVNLIIKKADLDITVYPLDDPDNLSDDGYDIYDGTIKKVEYTINNILPTKADKSSLIDIFYDDPLTLGIDESITEQGSMRFYPVELIGYDDLVKFYKNFDEESTIFKSGLSSIRDAGQYYCVIYYKNTDTRWNECIHIEMVEIKPKDIHISFSSSINKVVTYNGKQVSLSLWTANFDMTDLLPGHTIPTENKKYYTVLTKYADAGIYNPETDFVFGNMLIYDSTMTNVYKNYHPVLSDNVYVEITKAYLAESDFVVAATERQYDGTPAMPKITMNPNIIIDEDSFEATYEVYDAYNSLIPYDGDPSYVGKYYVHVAFMGDKNHYSSAESNIGVNGYKSASCTINPREVEVIWEDLNQTFNGATLTAMAKIIDVFENEHALNILYYDKDGNENTDGLVLASTYEIYAVFDTSTETGQMLEQNYTLKKSVQNFVIEKAAYEIIIGNEKNGYSIAYYSTETPWGMVITPTSFKSFPSANLDILNQYWSANPEAEIQTKGYLPGTYSTEAMFNLNLGIRTKSGLQAYNSAWKPNQNSIEITVKGSVDIVSNDIPFESNDIELVYDATSNITFASLMAQGMLILKKNVPCDITYQVTYPNGTMSSESTYLQSEGIFKEAGQYIISFWINPTGSAYKATSGEVILTIIPAESSVQVNKKKLNKVYDGVMVADFITSIRGNSALASDLKLEYYEFITIDGVTNMVPLNEDVPTDAGNYRVVITCTNEKLNKYGFKNYEDIYEEYDFTISPIKLLFKLDDYAKLENDNVKINKGGVTITNQDLGQPWTTGQLSLNAAQYDALPSGDIFTFSITTAFPLFRTTFSTINPTNKTPNDVIAGPDKVITEKVDDNGTPQTNEITVHSNQHVYTFKAKAESDNNDYEFILAWSITNDKRYRNDEDDPDQKVFVDLAKNYELSLDFDLYFHYKFIEGVTVTGYDGPYDGTPHSGSITIGSKFNGTVLTQEYATDVSKLGTPDAVSNISDISYTNPGEYKVAYRLQADVGTDYFEPIVDVFTIKISKLSRTVKVEDIPENKSKTYDGTPIFTQWMSGCPAYLPSLLFAYEKIDGNTLPDAYDPTEVKIQYRRNGSSAIASNVSITEAGTYSYDIVIPASANYVETKVSGTFTIAKRTLYLVNTQDNILPYQGGKLYYGITNTSPYYKVVSIDNGVETDVANIAIHGVLQVNAKHYFVNDEGNLEQYTGASSAGDSGIYSGASTASLDWYKTYSIYINDEDCSNNYLISLSKATLIVDKADMIVKENFTQSHDYDGELHGIEVVLISPVDGYDRLYYYDTETGTWVTSSTNYEFRQTGVYPVRVKITKKNYNDRILDYTLCINPTELIAEFIDPNELDKTYDGSDVALPRLIKTNSVNQGLDYNMYRFEYYEFDIHDPADPWLAFSSIEWDSSSLNWEETCFNDYGLTRPVNAGKYKVRVYIPECGHYSGTEIEMEFVISARTIDLEWSTNKLIYNGQVQYPTPKVNLDYFASDNVKLGLSFTAIGDNTPVQPINSGAYKATAFLDETIEYDALGHPVYPTIGGATVFPKSLNYIISDSTSSKTFTIEKRTATITLNQTVSADAELGLGATEFIFKYPTKTTNPIERFTCENIVSNSKVSPAIEHIVTTNLKLVNPQVKTYKSMDDFQWVDDSGHPTDLQIVDANGDVTSNYIIKYSINLKLDYNTVSVVSSGYTGIYDSKTHGITLQIMNLNANSYKIEYSINGINYYPASSSINKIKDVTVTDATPDGKEVFFRVSKLDATGAVDLGYTPATGSAFVKISAKPSGLQFANPFLDLSKVYDGIPINVTASDLMYDAEITNPTLEFKYYSIDDSDPLNVQETYLGQGYHPTIVGKYKLVVTMKNNVNGVSNFEDAEISTKFEISKRTVYISTKTPTVLIYNGLNGGTVWSADVNSSTLLSVENLAPNQSFHSNESIIKTLSANVGHYTNTKMVYNADGTIDEAASGQYRWQNGYRIYDVNGIPTTDNYEIIMSLDVKIVNSPIAADWMPTISVTYDGKEHGIPIDVIDYVDQNGTIYPKPGNPKIEYSTDGINYSETPISRKDVGTTQVIFKISAQNYNDFYGTATITVNGLNFGGITGGEGDGMYIQYDEEYIYSGYNYPTPVLMNCPSTGAQTVTYYHEQDVVGGEILEGAVAMTDVKDAGKYWFRLAIDTDGVYSAADNVATLTFEIKPMKVDVVWSDLNQTYDGTEKCPEAYYVLAQPDWGKGLGDAANDGKVYLEAISAETSTSTSQNVNEILNAIKTAAGTYNVVAYTNNSNYELCMTAANGDLLSPQETFTITKATIKEFKLLDGLTFTYRDDIKIIDSTNWTYTVDENDEIILIQDKDDNVIYDKLTASPVEYKKYKIVLPKDSDGNIENGVGTHTLKVVILDPDNYMWKTAKNSEPLEFDYEVEPLIIDEYNEDYDVIINFTESDTPIYDGTEKKPALVVKLIDKKENTVLETLVLNQDYELTYSNNIEVSETATNPDKATVKIDGVNNYSFSFEKNFTILAEAPQLITIREGSKIQFITAKYDATSKVAVVNDQMYDESLGLSTDAAMESYVLDRNADNLAASNNAGLKYYLGHIYQEITVKTLLTMLYDSDKILVFENRLNMEAYDYKDLAVPETSFVGTGYCVALYADDSHDTRIDYVECIIFGDMTGDGLINAADIIASKNMFMEVNVCESMGYELGSADNVYSDAIYFAGIVDRSSMNSVNAATIIAIKNCFMNVEGYAFNDDYKVENVI